MQKMWDRDATSKIMSYDTTLAFAKQKDAQDALKEFRKAFLFPQFQGEDAIYLCGNSLGLQPKATSEYIQTELDDWAKYAVEGHFMGSNPWLSYHQLLTPALAHIVGATEKEVVAMGSLTANLHLLMVSFYRPEGNKKKIMIEGNAFPSDRYAVLSQLRQHGFGEEDLVEVQPSQNGLFTRDDFKKAFEENKDEIAMAMIGGVNYTTGQVLPMKYITQLGHEHGATVGFDLAHAAGNITLSLHDWKVDFASWCSYKYMNSGPGGVSGIYVHENHHDQKDLPRFEGWWGNEEKSRFLMQKDFSPSSTVEAWQLSNAPVLSMAAHKASLDLFEKAGMLNLRNKSIDLTGYLAHLLSTELGEKVTIITPNNSKERGAQLSLKIKAQGKELVQKLLDHGVYIDFREPDIFRVSPVPLYNSFEDVYQFVQRLLKLL